MFPLLEGGQEERLLHAGCELLGGVATLSQRMEETTSLQTEIERLRDVLCACLGLG